MTKKIVILGTSGNCIDMLDTIACINDEAQETLHECVGFLDDNTATHGTTRHGVPVLGPLSLAPELQDCWFVNGIGSTATFTRKDAIIAKAAIPLQRFITLIHPSARISRTAQIGPGTVIFENVAVTSNVTIGMHVIILPNSVISHDVVIGDYTCITGESAYRAEPMSENFATSAPTARLSAVSLSAIIRWWAWAA